MRFAKPVGLDPLMRILIANPDTIGDLVLRQPLIAALTDAGHELMLIVRQSVASLARQIAPTAQVVEYPAEPYALSVDGPWEPFEPVFAAAAQFGPAVLMIAPYRWTLAEEKLAERLPSVPRVGMSGNLYRGDPYAGAAPVSSLVLDQVAQVKEDDLEITKNAALASLVLGRRVRLADPILTPPDDAMTEAHRLLDEVGFAPGGYWAACVGGTAHVALKTWPADRWAAALSHWSWKYGRKFLFIGLPAERAAVDDVLAAMGESATGSTAVLMRDDMSLATMEALIALSQGYTGHDTGPMHVAAAVGRPVLAVFGGGTWLRFLPAVTPSVAITVGAPCAGCGWICTFSESYCIKSVPTDDVIRAIDDLEAGRVIGRESRVIEPSPALMARFVRESAQAAEDRLREAVEARKQFATVATTTALVGDSDVTVEPVVSTVVNEVKIEPPTAEPTAPEPTAAQLIEQMYVPIRQQLVDLQKDLAALHHEVSTRLPIVEKAVQLPPPAPSPPPLPSTAPRSWRQVAVDLVVGRPHVMERAPTPLPPITVVIPLREAEPAALRATVESICSQDYENFEVLVVDDLRSEPVTESLASLGKSVRIINRKDGETFDLIADGFEKAYGQVLAFARPGVTYTPGLLQRVGELFRDKRFVKAAYFETISRAGGALVNIGPTRQIDTLDFLADEPLVYESIFWRRTAYAMVGQLYPGRGDAADWDLAIRTSRMFGIWRAGSAGAVINQYWDPTARATMLTDAREKFLAGFGTLGRVRCDVIRRLNRLNAIIEHRLGLARPTFDASSGAAELDPPPCPLSGRPADSFLFAPYNNVSPLQAYYSNACASALIRREDGAAIAHGLSNNVLETLQWATTGRASRSLLDLSDTNGVVMDAFTRGAADRQCAAILTDPARAAALREQSRCTVIEGAPMDAAFIVPDGKTFDIIVLGRALQRSADPLMLLRRTRNLLNPNGVIAVTADNLRSRALVAQGHHWAGWTRDASRVIFSPEGLRRLAKAANLRVAKYVTRTYDGPASRVANYFGQGDVIHAVIGE